jgi:hypothetical protein
MSQENSQEEQTTVEPSKANPPKKPLPVLSGEQVTIAFRQISDRLSKIEEEQKLLSTSLAGLTPDSKENMLVLVNDIRSVHTELHTFIQVIKTLLTPEAVMKIDTAMREVGK